MQKQILSICKTLVITVLAIACSGHEDNGELVPEGTLRIFVQGVTAQTDALFTETGPQILANGTDKVVFQVMYGSQDVSTSSEMNLIATIDGADRRLAAGENSFTTTAPGTYVITARYYDGQARYTDNEITVTALPTGEAQTSEWTQTILAMEFTSTTCTGCPALVSALELMEEKYPSVLCPVAFHLNYMGSDPMVMDRSQTFATELIGSSIALPALFYNMHQPAGERMTNISSVIEQELQTELRTYEPTCGISITSVCDPATRKTDIKVKVKSNIQQRCRLVLFIVEDGIVAAQLDDQDYVHNNVVRSVLTAGAYGDYINDGVALYPGLETTTDYSITLNSDWNIDNLRVVASVLVPDGNSYRADNTNTCGLKAGSSGYPLKN